jgi:hypothetical protein
MPSDHGGADGEKRGDKLWSARGEELCFDGDRTRGGEHGAELAKSSDNSHEPVTFFAGVLEAAAVSAD